MTKGIQIVLSLAVILVLGAIGWSWYDYRPANTITIPVTDTTGTTTTTTPSEGGAAGGTVPAGLTQGEQCKNMGGTWSEEYKECTGIDKMRCVEIGGTFNECASACRNDPNAQVCIMMCVQVCEFK